MGEALDHPLTALATYWPVDLTRKTNYTKQKVKMGGGAGSRTRVRKLSVERHYMFSRCFSLPPLGRPSTGCLLEVS